MLSLGSFLFRLLALFVKTLPRLGKTDTFQESSSTSLGGRAEYQQWDHTDVFAYLFTFCFTCADSSNLAAL